MASAPIRPPVWPPAPTNVQPGRNDARLAAQKAFFEAAMGGAAKPRPSPSADPEPTAKASPAEAVRTVAAAEARATDRLPPPGSIINILV